MGATSSPNAASPNAWSSAIAATTVDGINIRGYDLRELIGEVSFTSVVHLLYSGELPTPAAAALLDALMVASIDHGPGTPSVLAARTVTSGGATFQAGAAAGLLAMGQYHAAAVGDCMEAVLSVGAETDAPGAAKKLVADYRSRGDRLPGFGHRQHKTRDPRVGKLFGMAREQGVDGRYIAAAEAIEAALQQATGRLLPINIDGVYAAVLAEIGVPADSANAIFIASRMAGVMAHVVEERTTMPPMRRIDPVAHSYSGPPSRPLPTNESGDRQSGEKQ